MIARASLRMLSVLGTLQALVVAGPAGVGSSVATLTAKEATAHFEIFYRPGSAAGAAVDRIAWQAERDYERILDTLALKGRVDDSGPFHLFLYDDVPELSRITRTEGNGGFSTARESHVPYDNDQTRLHEMVHILMAAVKETGPESRNMFFAEGIANAVLRFVHGVPVHAVAAYEKRRGSLPPLATLTAGDFYAYLQSHPGFNGYDVGGSFLLFALETYGPRKTVDYCKGKPAQAALGVSLARVEQRWQEFLDHVPIRPELEALLAQRRGDPAPANAAGADAPRLTPEFLGDPKEWIPFAADLELDSRDELFRRETDAITGTGASQDDWAVRLAPSRAFAHCMVRGTIRALGDCRGVQLRVGRQFQAMILTQGSYLYFQDEGGIGFSDGFRFAKDQSIDLLLVVRDGSQEVWIDGTKWLEAAMPAQEGPIGIGVVGGRAEFRDLKVRRLD